MRITTSNLVVFGEQASMRNRLKKLPIEDQCLVSLIFFVNFFFIKNFLYQISEVPVEVKNKYGFPIPLKSPYRKLLLMYFLKLLESGILNKIQISSMPQMPTCNQSLFQIISLSDVFTAFVIIFCAFLASIIFVVGEKYCFNRRKFLISHLSHQSIHQQFNT